MRIARAIDDAVAFFHLFDHPLTVTELWRALRMEETVSLWDVDRALATNPEFRDRLRVEGGWVFRKASASEDCVARRQERLYWTDQKYKKALRFVRWMRLFPFVRMVAIGNSLAFQTTREHSDIDFFMIVERGHIWTARFWLVVMAKLLRQRPQEGHEGTHRPDALCFVYFVTTDGLNLERTKVGEEDRYLEYWITHLRPVFDADRWYCRFLDANRWATAGFPNWTPVIPSHWRTVWPRPTLRMLQLLFEMIHRALGAGIERVLKEWQLRLLPQHLRAAAERPTAVLLSDKMLKFHENDRRAEINAAWSALRQ